MLVIGPWVGSSLFSMQFNITITLWKLSQVLRDQ